MTRRLPDREALRWRTAAQALTGTRSRDVSGVLRAVFALPAQDQQAARLGVRARSDGLVEAAVRSACDVDRSAVRTWAMRGTLHMLSADDVGWVIDLLGPINIAAGRRRRLQLGLDDDLCERALGAIRLALGRGTSLTRGQLVDALAIQGVVIDRTTNAAAHLMAYGAARGLICCGPDRDDGSTYVLLEDWVGKRASLGRDESLAELARRYLCAHEPAELADFATWSGLPNADARRAFHLLRHEVAEVEVAGRSAWLLSREVGDDRSDDAGGVEMPALRLLGGFDAFLLGYRNRDLLLAPTFARRVNAGGGWIHPVLVVDGRVIATWRLVRAHDRVEVLVRPFAQLEPGLDRLLEVDARDVGRFLGRPVSLSIVHESIDQGRP
jgi:hypothetical protein